MSKTLTDAARRRHLQMLAWAAFGAALPPPAAAQWFGKRPAPLPPGRSIFQLQGEVYVDGMRAGMMTSLKGGETITTGAGASLVAVLGGEGLLIRQHSRVELPGAAAAKRVFRLAQGAMLSVFGQRSDEAEIIANGAILGIRGTGLYVETSSAQTYVCTCYGTVAIRSASDPRVEEIITSRHHDAPRTVISDTEGARIVPAGFRDHTDLELVMLEALLGRQVPFGVTMDNYESPRRDY